MAYNLKMTTLASALVLAIATTGPTHANNTSEKELRKDINEVMQSMENYTETKRDQAVGEIEQALNALDRELDAYADQLREDWHTMKEATREDNREALKDLRKSRNILSEKFGELKSGSTDAWDELKSGFNQAWMDFKSSWDNAFNSAQKDGKS